MQNKRWFFTTVVLAFCSIVYELLMATTLSYLTGSYVWWHSWTIAFYIAGLGLGSYLSNKYSGLRTFIKIELALSFIGVLCIFVIQLAHLLATSNDTSVMVQSSPQEYDLYNLLFKYGFFIFTEVIVLTTGLLSGFEIPLILEQVNKNSSKNEENRVLALNYFGTLLGTLAFTFLLYPHFKLIHIGIIIGLINFLVCFFMMKEKKLVFTFIFSGLALLSFLYLPGFENFYYKHKYFFGTYEIKNESGLRGFVEDHKKFGEIERLKTLYQNIDFVKYDLDEKEFRMFLDGNFQFSTKTESRYHEAFAHFALAIAKSHPKKVLVLGAGDGMLIRELLKYDSIEQISHIELDGDIYDLFRTQPLNKLNDFAFDSPRVKTTIGDGFYFVRNNKEKYDAIFIDFPYPKNYDIARLYSLEFYSNVKKRLNENGIVVLDAPLFDKDLIEKYGQESNNILLSTLHYSGFKNLKPFKVDDESFILASNGEELKGVLSEEYSSKLKGTNLEDFNKIYNQTIPYRIEKQFVNSIFFPKIVEEWQLAPSYF